MVTKQYIVVENPFCRVERVKVKLLCLLIGTCISAERNSKILNVNFYMYMHLVWFFFYLNKLKVPITVYGFSAVLEINLKCFLSIIKPQILLQRIRQLLLALELQYLLFLKLNILLHRSNLLIHCTCWTTVITI